jgi:hypothetical protein
MRMAVISDVSWATLATMIYADRHAGLQTAGGYSSAWHPGNVIG